MNGPSKKNAKDLIYGCYSGLVVCLLLHLLMLNVPEYSSLPYFVWSDKTYGAEYSLHYGLIGLISFAIIALIINEIIRPRVRLRKCSKCGLTRAITKTTVLLTKEEKEDLYKHSPMLFTAIGIDLQKAIESSVTANYISCSECNHHYKSRLRTDAHIGDDFYDAYGSGGLGGRW